MKMKKKHIKPKDLLGMETVFEYMKVDGKYYKFDSKDGKNTLVQVSKKEVDSHMKMAKELAENLKDSFDASKVLTEIFMTKYDKEHLEKLHKTVFKGKRKYKPKTREGHCVDMKVGNHIIPIID